MTQRYRRLAVDRWGNADDEYGVFGITVDSDRVAIDYERLATPGADRGPPRQDRPGQGRPPPAGGG